MTYKINQAIDEMSKSTEVLLKQLDVVDFSIPETINALTTDEMEKRKLKLFGIWAIYQDIVCSNENIEYLFNSDEAERQAALICAVADLLAFNGALTVSVLIVRESLIASCKNYWEKSKG